MGLISARQAAALLAEAGLSRSQSRRLLATGIAGLPVRTTSTHLYEGSRIRALVAWPPVDVFSMPSPSDRALLEVRGGAVEGCATTGLLRLSHLGAAVRAQLREAASRYGCVPVVVTSSSFVVAAYEATEVYPERGGWGSLQVRRAGSWAEAFREHRLYSPAGNQWLLWTPELVPDLG